MNHDHVVECGAVAPLLIRCANRKIVFNARPSIFIVHAAYNTRGHTRRSINSQAEVPTSSLRGPILRRIIFTLRSALMFCTAACSASRAISPGILKLGPCSSNHYHFVAQSPRDSEDASSLSQMLGLLHARTAGWINRLDGEPKRKVWHNFWDTKLTYEKSYLARLNYVHQNAIKHGLVPVANQYQWCSARWFEQIASPRWCDQFIGLKSTG